jgi:hypothetical protein
MIVYKDSIKKRFQESLLTLLMTAPVFLLAIVACIVYLQHRKPDAKIMTAVKRVLPRDNRDTQQPVFEKEAEQQSTSINENMISDKIIDTIDTAAEVTESTQSEPPRMDRMQPIVSNAQQSLSRARILAQKGRYEEALSILEAGKASAIRNNETKTATVIIYSIAIYKTALYKSGKIKGPDVIIAWHKVKDSFSPSSKEYNQADSILTLFGENR